MVWSSKPVVMRWWSQALCLLAAILLCPFFWIFILLLATYRLLAFLLTGVLVTNAMGIDTLLAQDRLGPDNMIVVMVMGDKRMDVPLVIERFQQYIVDAKVDDGSRKRLPKFSSYLKFRMGFPVWCEAGDVRVVDHMYQLPGEVGSQEELEEVVNERCNRRMTHGRPSWEGVFINMKEGWRLAHYDGEEVPGCMLLFRCHHCYADGVTMVRAMCEILATNNEKIVDSVRDRLGNVKQMRRDVMGRLAVSSVIVLLTGIVLVPYYCIRMLVGRDRGLLRSSKVRTGRSHFCWSPPVPVAKIKAIKLAMSARSGVTVTVNDVVMSCVAGALRRFLSDRQEHVPDQLKAYMPVNVQSLDKPLTDGNKLVTLQTEMATGVADPVERVLASKRLVDRIKTSVVDWMMSDLLVRSSGILPRPLAFFMNRVGGCSLVFSNVPGPSIQGEFVGSRITQAFAFVPHTKAVGLSVAFQSYVDHIVMTVTMDKGLGEDLELARGLVQGVLDELDLVESRLKELSKMDTAGLTSRALALTV